MVRVNLVVKALVEVVAIFEMGLADFCFILPMVSLEPFIHGLFSISNLPPSAACREVAGLLSADKQVGLPWWGVCFQ